MKENKNGDSVQDPLAIAFTIETQNNQFNEVIFDECNFRIAADVKIIHNFCFWCKILFFLHFDVFIQWAI